MNREEAIAIIRKEYLCVDRDCDIERNCGKCDLMMPSKEPILEAYKMAIKALEQEPKTDSWSIKDVADTFKKHGLIREQEPCEDAISRQAVLDILKREGRKWGNDYRDWVDAIEEIKNLSSVNPTKTGWIPVSERLPEDEQEILFSTKTGRVHSGKYHDDDSANQWYSHRDKCRAWNNVVTAWMPLPKPYEPQESEEE